MRLALKFTTKATSHLTEIDKIMRKFHASIFGFYVAEKGTEESFVCFVPTWRDIQI
jgi:hypothetical protein